MVFIIINMLHVTKIAFAVLLFISTALHGADNSGCSNPVYLTFDTGNMKTAEEIANTLKQKNVRATFFLANNKTFKGTKALSPAWQKFWKTRVSEGHGFGNHTWSHYFVRQDINKSTLKAYGWNGKPVKLNERAFCAELKKVQSAFYKLTGYKLDKIWRAPAGRTTQNSIRWAAGCGYPIHVGWSKAGYIRDDISSERLSNRQLLKHASKHIKKGDIVLMHLGVWDRKEQAASILPALIDNLRKRRLCFMPLGGMGS